MSLTYFATCLINKRMPAKNSPTNEKGVLCDTILKENIIFLRKL